MASSCQCRIPHFRHRRLAPAQFRRRFASERGLCRRAVLLFWRCVTARSRRPAFLTAAHAAEPSPLALLALVQNLQDFEHRPSTHFPHRERNRLNRWSPPKPLELLEAFQLREDLLETSVNEGQGTIHRHVVHIVLHKSRRPINARGRRRSQRAKFETQDATRRVTRRPSSRGAGDSGRK